jgi:hypothetical protein
MADQTETKPRTEAPIASVVLGSIAFVAAFIATTPGIPLIVGAIGAIAGLVEIGRAQRDQRRPNVLAIIGVTAALAGILISFLTTAA